MTSSKFPAPVNPEFVERERTNAVPSKPVMQPNNPLHGVTLEAMLIALVERFGWAGLAKRLPINCFVNEPSIKSSLKFLRKTEWARQKLESLYLMLD